MFGFNLKYKFSLSTANANRAQVELMKAAESC